MKKFSMSRIVMVVILLWIVEVTSAFAAVNYNVTAVNNEFLKNTEPINLTIMGSPLATEEQCVSYLLRHNPFPQISVDAAQLVNYYYTEGALEGVRSDVVFAQALHETGNFAYGGDVVPLQNNYCGLGTTGRGVKGAWFPSAQIGVRAQIQHLLAYSTERPPLLDLVDPRYNLVKNSDRFGQAVFWTDLNGKWAVPGRTYGQKILKIHEKILTGN